jgi:hypothetical protein
MLGKTVRLAPRKILMNENVEGLTKALDDLTIELRR